MRTPTTETVYARPLLIVPPWINTVYVLDLQPANSLITFATDNGIQTFVVSWRNPNASHAELDFNDYVDHAVTFFAALTDFSEAGDVVNFLGPSATAFIGKRTNAAGVLAASETADTFNMLRANGKAAPAFDLLYWNSDATRLPAWRFRPTTSTTCTVVTPLRRRPVPSRRADRTRRDP